MRLPHLFHRWQYAHKKAGPYDVTGASCLNCSYRKCRQCGEKQMYVSLYDDSGWETLMSDAEVTAQEEHQRRVSENPNVL